MNLTPDTSPQGKTASTTVPVHPLLAERWSPRGFDRAHEIGDEALAALLEAARWAPSAQNSQPWRFLVTRRGEPAHDRLFAALAPGNQAWAGRASALVLVAARTAGDDGRPQPWALYDTGQAVAALVTQAQADGLAVHQMGGFDTDVVRAGFGLADGSLPSSSWPSACPATPPDCPSHWPPARPPPGPGARSATCCCPPHLRPSSPRPNPRAQLYQGHPARL